jgi:transcriptional regulator with XRE-family HTH domain
MTIGERIKQGRQAKGWTQRQLAEHMGYSNHSTVARAEAGKMDLPLSRVSQFAEVLGVSAEHLMGWKEEPEEFGALAAEVLKDPELLQLVKNYRELSAADRATVGALVSSLAIKKD